MWKKAHLVGAGFFAFVNKVSTFVLGKGAMFTKKPPCPCQDEWASFQQPNTVNTDASSTAQLSSQLSPCPWLPLSHTRHKFTHLHRCCSFVRRSWNLTPSKLSSRKIPDYKIQMFHSDRNSQWPRKPSCELSFLIKQTALPCHVN